MAAMFVKTIFIQVFGKSVFLVDRQLISLSELPNSDWPGV